MQHEDGPRPPRGQKLTDAILEHTLAGASQREAAERIGCARSTVYRKLADPEVRAQLDQLRHERLVRVTDSLSEASLLAVETLAGIMSDPTAPPLARVKAAVAVLQAGAQHRQETDLAARVVALEQALAHRPQLGLVEGGRR